MELSESLCCAAGGGESICSKCRTNVEVPDITTALDAAKSAYDDAEKSQHSGTSPSPYLQNLSFAKLRSFWQIPPLHESLSQTSSPPSHLSLLVWLPPPTHYSKPINSQQPCTSPLPPSLSPPNPLNPPGVAHPSCIPTVTQCVQFSQTH